MKNKFSFFLVCLIFLSIFLPQIKAQTGIDKLKGKWTANNYGEVYSLEILSGSKMIFNGEQIDYQVFNNAFVISDDYDVYYYPFRLEGEKLYVTFPEGDEVVFSQGSAELPAQKGITQNTGASGSEIYLQGRLCSYSSSSSSTGSYSTTYWTFFDGKGNFQYGSGSSYSGSSSDQYGNETMNYGGVNQGDASTGAYRIEGNKVMLTFPDGTSGAAEIYMRQNDGSITEIMYNGTLYGKALCE
ncbi:MAG: hypothetical protein K9J16_18455 [Melioribacteraceae bacterium]|nr:hypothetical protein [Melioribacteraceae bacterium]MCF8355240.1 hypothetical protein [Melioribacteraceae bacterium]MCF8395227.1 hypothetical protein [Melioribacteraceae bacterium]MCF8420701.1 hypothetical protein [Melioribacteraceae bacterium]